MNGEDEDDAKQHDSVILDIGETEIIQLDAICRVCANNNGRIIGIFSEEGVTHDLAVKMNMYLPVKVAEADTLPLQCCWNCASTVLAWHEFVIGSVEADRRLRELQIIASKAIVESVKDEHLKSQSTTEFEPESTGASLTAFYETTSTSDEPVRSPQNSQAVKLEDIPETALCETTEDSSTSKVIISGKSAKGREEAKESRTRTTKRRLNSRKSNTQTEEPPTSTENKPSEDIKMEMYHFACQYCSFVFLHEDDVVQHVRDKHPDEIDVIPADPLLPSVNNKNEKRKHTKIDQEAVNAAKIVVDGRVYYNCKICGKSLHSPYTYMWHMRIHTGERPYVCDLCGKQFRVSQGLVRHLRETHEGIKNFPCDLCGRMFATRRNVEEHRRIHTNERPYICDLCGKAFKQKASLFVHNRSHSDYFPYRCSYCSQGFRTRPPLLIHVTRHTGEKPYPCDVCGRCFRIKYELKRHRLVHSDEKPFTCTECGLSFRQKRYLRNHNKTNHNRLTPKVAAEQSEEEWEQKYLIQQSDYSDIQRNEHNDSCETDEIEVVPSSTEFRNRRRKSDIKYKIFCDICKKGYTRRSDMKRHRKLKHSNDCDEIRSETDSAVVKINVRSCRYCKEKFDTLTQLKVHVKTKHGVARFRRKHDEITAEYFCDLCEKGFTRNHDMKKHRRLKHPDTGIVEEVRRNERVGHLKKLKIIGPDNRSYYKCDVCKKVFQYAYNMLRHQTTHTKVYGFVCHICAKRFPSSGGLRRHLNEHHYGVKRFSCEICGRSFAANATKEEHMNIHTNNRPFVCDICGKAFKQKASLRSHKLFHTNDFRFSCNFCQKKFRRAYELKTHTWTHTGHRPHQCPLCSRAFRLGQDLRRHLMVHDKLDECSCDECGAIFSQQKYLNNHKRSHRRRSGKMGKLVNVNVSGREEVQVITILGN